MDGSAPIAQRSEGLAPYAEGSDLFIERSGDLIARLHVDRATGHAQFLPLPDARAVAEFYGGVYSRPGSSPDPRAEYVRAQLARDMRDHVLALGLPSLARAHDVGCGVGALVHGFQELGVEASGNDLNGAEASAGAPHCRGALFAGPLTDSPTRDVDLFVALHVLEHLPDPVAELATMRERMTPEGMVFICVPNGHCMRTLVGGYRNDPAFHFPGHLHYFTAKSMIAAVRAAGLEAVTLGTRALAEWDGGLPSPALQAVLGIPAALMPDPDAWANALNANLLGYELVVVAARAENVTARREHDLDMRADKALQAFMHRRGH